MNISAEINRLNFRCIGKTDVPIFMEPVSSTRRRAESDFTGSCFFAVQHHNKEVAAAMTEIEMVKEMSEVTEYDAGLAIECGPLGGDDGFTLDEGISC